MFYLELSQSSALRVTRYVPEAYKFVGLGCSDEIETSQYKGDGNLAVMTEYLVRV